MQWAQNNPSLSIRKIQEPIVLDGLLTEASWEAMEPVGGFWQYFPFDTSMAVARTEVRMMHDENNIYIAAILYDSLPGEYITQSLRRDFRGLNTDGFSVVIDPFRDQTNGFFFGINPFGVHREGLIANGGETDADLDLSWDNIWQGEVKVYDDRWVVEMAIPFTTLRFRGGATQWGINFYRIDTKYNERSVWSRVPRQLLLENLAFTGTLEWDRPLDKTGGNVTLIPFAAGGTSRDYLANEDWTGRLDAGGDAKIALTPSLNLDVTFNPDFSQVEVDVQQTNIDRFEIFFPERRQFFLENADLFASFGFNNARPFFSRRIGVAIDSATGQNVQNRILLGARLSGKLNRNWRVGLLNMQTASDESIGQPSYNYTVAAVQRQVFARSNISAIFVNKANFDQQPVDISNPLDGASSQLIGIDYNLASADGKWNGKAYYHQTFDDDTGPAPFSHGARIAYNTLRFFASWEHQIIGQDFDTKVGFVPRRDFRRANPVVGFNIYPNSDKINRHQFFLSNNLIWNDTWGLTDYNFALNYTLDFQSSAGFAFALLSNYVKLFAPFNPTGNPTQLFQPGDDFVQTGFLAAYNTDLRKAFFGRIQLISGGFFNGNLRQLSGEFNYRYRQYATVAVNYTINRIDLKEGFDDATLYLVGPRIDLTLTRSLFLTTFVQYNSQFDNININSRLQWRFRPVSDLFIVYTDNYFPEALQPKNRALVFKATYWLNL
ncbi:MAG TPA: DUF5916 domain-containing protein [Saprospiraceae bacterium]|nr:DUF5916 domain-containing protein [Saprospiraceae bacterium]HMP25524.1 DUF5916 domain-containing protein [Saprospiraceae bacterium]